MKCLQLSRGLLFAALLFLASCAPDNNDSNGKRGSNSVLPSFIKVQELPAQLPDGADSRAVAVQALATLPDGRLFLYQPLTGSQKAYVQLYDVSKSRFHAFVWSSGAPVLDSPSALVLADGRVALVGGQLSDQSSPTQIAFFNPADSSWKMGAAATAQITSPNALLTSQNKIVTDQGVYDIATDQWVKTLSYESAAYVELPDGNILAVGGYAQGQRASGPPKTTATVLDKTTFDPVGTSTETLAEGLGMPTTVLAQDSTVWLGGGYNTGATSPEVGLYTQFRPPSGTWAHDSTTKCFSHLNQPAVPGKMLLLKSGRIFTLNDNGRMMRRDGKNFWTLKYDGEVLSLVVDSRQATLTQEGWVAVTHLEPNGQTYKSVLYLMLVD